jgi:hypothetical protein
MRREWQRRTHMANIEEVRQQLQEATERLNRAKKALAPKHKGGEWEEYRAAHQEVLRLERELAAASGEMYAETLEFPVRWCTGAPLPQLLANDFRALLAFVVSEPDPSWDGTYTTVREPADPEPSLLGLVEFDGYITAKLGAPNDEVFRGHPLAGKGLEAYRPQRIVNSRWLEEIEAINRVHPMYRSEFWRDLHHFIFWFHDTTFECIARSFKVETHRMSMKEMLGLMVERLTA